MCRSLLADCCFSELALNPTKHISLVQSGPRYHLVEMQLVHGCVQTDPAKNVWTRAYLIPERNQTVRIMFIYLFFA